MNAVTPWHRSTALALGITVGGLTTLVARGWAAQREWELATPGGMGTKEEWLRLVVENALFAFIVLLVVAAPSLLPRARGNRARFVSWAAAPLAVFVGLVPPREATFFANGGVDDGLIGPAVALICVIVTALFRFAPRAVGLASAGLSLLISAVAARAWLSVEQGHGLADALVTTTHAGVAAAILLVAGIGSATRP